MAGDVVGEISMIKEKSMTINCTTHVDSKDLANVFAQMKFRTPFAGIGFSLRILRFVRHIRNESKIRGCD